MNNSQKIQDFWDWFRENEASLRTTYDNEEYESLSQIVSAGIEALSIDIGWEMGPYALPDYAFVLSPGSRELTDTCRRIINAAPVLSGWHFFAGKPAKDMLSLTIEIDGVEVCADNWRYKLTSYNGGEFADLELFFEANDAPPAEKESIACELLVESLLGELVSLERVGYIESSRVDCIADVEQSTELRFLKNHLESVLKPLN